MPSPRVRAYQGLKPTCYCQHLGFLIFSTDQAQVAKVTTYCYQDITSQAVAVLSTLLEVPIKISMIKCQLEITLFVNH